MFFLCYLCGFSVSFVVQQLKTKPQSSQRMPNNLSDSLDFEKNRIFTFGLTQRKNMTPPGCNFTALLRKGLLVAICVAKVKIY